MVYIILNKRKIANVENAIGISLNGNSTQVDKKWANLDIAVIVFLKFYDKVGEFYGRISCGN